MSRKDGEPFIVLVADDDDEVRSIFCIYIRRKGFAVVEASTGVEAVEKSKLRRPSLILMDLSMPEMDGIAAARVIRQDETLREIPIVFITAHGDYGIRLFGESGVIDNGGPIEYLPKPTEFLQLDELLKKYSGRQSLS
jgi:CheY-like chemotaxis protein